MDPEAAPDDSENPFIFQPIIGKILADGWFFVKIAVTDDRSFLHIKAGLIAFLDGFRVDCAISCSEPSKFHTRLPQDSSGPETFLGLKSAIGPGLAM